MIATRPANTPRSVRQRFSLTSVVARLLLLVGAGIVERLRQMYCGLHGHDNLMHFEKQRVYLRCSSCGHESPGWMLKEAEPKVVWRGDGRHQARARPHLLGARRIA